MARPCIFRLSEFLNFETVRNAFDSQEHLSNVIQLLGTKEKE